MSHTIRLNFGPQVAIEITRDTQRRVSLVETYLNKRVEGYRLDTNPDRREGTLYSMPTNVIGERYKNGSLEVASALGEGQKPLTVDYLSWIHRCVQQATAWARSTAIANANAAAMKGDHLTASDTYRDVLDHFPPPPESSLLHWSYQCCIAEMDGVDIAREGLLMWFHDALQAAGLDAISQVLQPAQKLLGSDTVKLEAEKWLALSSPHDPAHKMTLRWMNRIGLGELQKTRWETLDGIPYEATDRQFILQPNGNVVSIGGLNAQREPLPHCAIWSLKDSKWRLISPLPHGIARHALISLFDGTVLCIGGEAWIDGKRKRCQKTVWAWDPKTDSWSTKASLNIGRQDHAALVSTDGRVVVVGGESPLQTESVVELWDRRANKWAYGPKTGIRMRDIQLQKRGHDILIAGPSVSASGSGALILNVKTDSILPSESLKGIGIDGLTPLQDGNVAIWAKSASEINIGLWSAKKNSISWACSEIPLPQRDDLAWITLCEDEHFLLLYPKEDLSCGAKIVRPQTGMIDEIDAITGSGRLQGINAITLSDGRVLVADHQASYILSK